MKVALRCKNGQFVAAENNGGSNVNANRDRALAWERFSLVNDDSGGCVVITGNGYLFQSIVGTDVRASSRCLDTEGTHHTVVELGGGNVAIQTDHDTYWTAEGGGGSHLAHDRTVIGPWERFRLYDLAHETPPDNTGVDPVPSPHDQLRGEFLTHRPFDFTHAGWSEADRRHLRERYELGGLNSLPMSLKDHYREMPSYTEAQGRVAIQELIEDGIAPTIFCLKDDEPRGVEGCKRELDRVVSICKPYGVRHWALCWEMNDAPHLRDGTDLVPLFQHLRSLVGDDLIVAHWAPNWWGPGEDRSNPDDAEHEWWQRVGDACDGIFFQVPWRISDEELRHTLFEIPLFGAPTGMVGRIVDRAKRRFYLFEHSRNHAAWQRHVDMVKGDPRVSGWM